MYCWRLTSLLAVWGVRWAGMRAWFEPRSKFRLSDEANFLDACLLGGCHGLRDPFVPHIFVTANMQVRLRHLLSLGLQKAEQLIVLHRGLIPMVVALGIHTE